MKLVTWNTQSCVGLDGVASAERIVAVARELLDFDVLCLQEIAVGYPGLQGGQARDQPALLRELLPGFQVLFGAGVDEWDGDGTRAQFGNLIATRLPVAQLRQHALPYPADPSVCSMPRGCLEVTVRDPALGPVRVMTTHLEYYSKLQRLAQAQALRDLHSEACDRAATPPVTGEAGSPFQDKPHTSHAVVCGDFNFSASDPEYAAIQRPSSAPGGSQQLCDAWCVLHGAKPQPPTFRVHGQHRKATMACDFVFVSESLKARVRSVAIDSATQASDHQPVALELA